MKASTFFIAVAVLATPGAVHGTAKKLTPIPFPEVDLRYVCFDTKVTGFRPDSEYSQIDFQYKKDTINDVVYTLGSKDYLVRGGKLSSFSEILNGEPRMILTSDGAFDEKPAKVSLILRRRNGYQIADIEFASGSVKASSLNCNPAPPRLGKSQ